MSRSKYSQSYMYIKALSSPPTPSLPSFESVYHRKFLPWVKGQTALDTHTNKKKESTSALSILKLLSDHIKIHLVLTGS